MKKIISTVFIFLSSGFISGIVFYYLIVIPLTGSVGVQVRVSGIKDIPYIIGESIDVEGIITNSGKNTSTFIISAAVVPLDSHPLQQKKPNPSQTFPVLQNFLGIVKKEDDALSNGTSPITDSAWILRSKSYSLGGGESRHFSFHLPTNNLRIDNISKCLLKLSAARSSAVFEFFRNDKIIFSKTYNLVLLPTTVSLSDYLANHFPAKVSTPPEEIVHSSIATSARTPSLIKRGAQILESKPVIATSPLIEEEIISADFRVMFPQYEDNRLRYNKTSVISASIKNKATGKEPFEVFLKIISPNRRERTISRTIMLLPSEEKRVDFLYNVNDKYEEGEYRFFVWYRTRQAVSEEIFDARYVLIDEEPRISIKKMLVNPVKGQRSEVVLEATDDIGIREVFFSVRPVKVSGDRGEVKNIALHLFSGDEKNGLWKCEYIPEKSDAYEFSFVAIDTKRHRVRLGEFPVKVIR